MQSKPTNFLVLWVWSQFLSYFSFIFLSSLVVQLFGLIIVSIAETSLLEFVTLAISHTPTLGLNGSGTFSLEASDIVQFFLFWAFIAKIVWELAAKYLKLKSNDKFLPAIITVVHIFAGIKLVPMDARFLQVIVIFYLFSFVELYMYKRLNSYSKLVGQIANRE